MSEWQTIETAPKDGTEVLVFYGVGCELVHFVEEDGRWERTWDGTELDYDPTHWMPLPDAPK